MINFNLTECDPDKLLKKFTEKFKGQYGVEYISALHYNKTKTNYHIHLIFSERWLLEAPDNKISTHAVYFDKTGKRMRQKIPYFKSKGFLAEVKELLTGQINFHVRKEEK